MIMDRKTLIARLRQLQAIDINALAIYTELAKEDDYRKVFSAIADDEKRHVALSKKMLSLLEQ